MNDTDAFPNAEPSGTGAAAVAGLEAGLVGVLATLALQLLLWLIGPGSVACIIVPAVNLLALAGIGGLASYWSASRGESARGRQALAGAVSGLMGGLTLGLTFGLVTFVFNRGPSTYLRSMGYSQGDLFAAGGLVTGCMTLPAGAVLGPVLGIVGAVITGKWLIPAGRISASMEVAARLGEGAAVPQKPEAPPRALSQETELAAEHDPREVDAASLRRIDLPTADLPDEVQAAVESLRAGERKQAVGALAVWLQKHPQDKMAWLWMAQAIEDPRRKLESVERALAIDPQDMHARQMMAVLKGSGEEPVRTGEPNDEPAKARGSSWRDRRLKWVRIRLLVVGLAVIFLCLWLAISQLMN